MGQLLWIRRWKAAAPARINSLWLLCAAGVGVDVFPLNAESLAAQERLVVWLSSEEISEHLGCVD